MARTTGNVKSVERWTVKSNGATVTIRKAVVRNSLGQFHGATNFRVNPRQVVAGRVQA